MVKHEIKVEFTNTESLRKIIEKAYFEEGTMGKITGNQHYVVVEEADEAYSVIKGLHNVTIKVTNDLIDGSMRFIIDESNDDLRISPISIYCIKEEERYIFY
jgi:hypothetical protein